MNLCVIPARGGSKRIPYKNIRKFHGKPIIVWSIEAAFASGCFDRVIVSTDDNKIAEVALEYGAEVPFIRPAELADDHVGTVPVIQHAVQWFHQHQELTEYVCCLHATAPFVLPENLIEGLKVLQACDVDYVFSAAEFESSIQRSFRILPSGLIELIYPDYLNSRTQDLESAYYNAGQFYWGNGSSWADGKRVFLSRSKPLLLQRGRVQDIDTIDDWEYAEVLFKSM